LIYLYFGSLILQLLIFAYFIKIYIPLKRICKIGFINITIIAGYIGFYIFIFFMGINFYYIVLSIAVYIFIIYRLYYLSIEIEFSFSKGEKTFRYFHQRDKRWKKTVLGNSTVGKNGCGIAVIAMILSAINENTNLDEICNWINENNKIPMGTPITAIKKYLDSTGLETKFLSREIDLRTEITDNTAIIVFYRNRFACLHKVFGVAKGHVILLYDIKDNKSYIADPASYSKTIRPKRLNRLLKKINRLPQKVKRPYISLVLPGQSPR